MFEYDSIVDLLINFLAWFLLGAFASYAFFSLMEYINGQPNKD